MFALLSTNSAMAKSSLNTATVLVFVTALASSGFSQPANPTIFIDFVSKRLTVDSKDASKPTPSSRIAKFCDLDRRPVARRVFAEYGAMFVASSEVTLPSVCYFPDEKATKEFQ